MHVPPATFVPSSPGLLDLAQRKPLVERAGSRCPPQGGQFNVSIPEPLAPAVAAAARLKM